MTAAPARPAWCAARLAAAWTTTSSRAARTAVHLAPYATRMTTHGPTLYAAWHATDEILVYDIPTARALPSIHPAGYDTWVMGMAATDDGLLVLNANVSEGRVAIFDLETGAWLRDVHPEVGPAPMVSGLACVTTR